MERNNCEGGERKEEEVEKNAFFEKIKLCASDFVVIWRTRVMALSDDEKNALLSTFLRCTGSELSEKQALGLLQKSNWNLEWGICLWQNEKLETRVESLTGSVKKLKEEQESLRKALLVLKNNLFAHDEMMSTMREDLASTKRCESELRKQVHLLASEKEELHQQISVLSNKVSLHQPTSPQIDLPLVPITALKEAQVGAKLHCSNCDCLRKQISDIKMEFAGKLRKQLELVNNQESDTNFKVDLAVEKMTAQIKLLRKQILSRSISVNTGQNLAVAEPHTDPVLSPYKPTTPVFIDEMED